MIAIDLGIYAISNSLLNKQLKFNTVFDERRYEETKAEIETLSRISSTSKEMLENIRSRLNEEEKILNENKSKLECLTLNGSVKKPCIGFLLAIFFAGFIPTILELFSMVTVFWINTILYIFAIISFGYGTYRLYCTLSAIEHSANNLPLPNFDVYFDNGEQEIELPANTDLKLGLNFQNIGYDIAELVCFSAFFPPGFDVNEDDAFYDINVQPSFVTYPKYTRVSLNVEYQHIDSGVGIEVDLKTPQSSGIFNIPVQIDEKKITETSFSLAIKIV